MRYRLRDFKASDAVEVNRTALAAFEQYRSQYIDWPTFAGHIGKMAALAETAELVIAESELGMVGAVAYVGPNKPKNAFFEPGWSIMRMLVVSPSARGLGIGHKLAQECLNRARRDGSAVFALHTTPIMEVALAMYERMGFKYLREAPPIFGVPYGVYVKQLGT